MKKVAMLVMGLAWASVCRAEGEGKPLFIFDDSRAQTIAREAICKKYPGTPLTNLVYTGWSAESRTNSSAVIILEYEIWTPETSVEKTPTDNVAKKSKSNTITVLLTEVGGVRYVAKSGRTIVVKSKQKPATAKASQPAP